MTPPLPPTRENTIALIAASIPLAPDAAHIRAQLTRAALNWDDALYLADGHGITPLLYQLWRRLDVLALIPTDAQTRMAQAYRDNATRNADARREFRTLIEMMEHTRVETIVMKGLPLLDQLYADPAERVLYDFDLLARDKSAAQLGYDALLAAGFTPVPTKTGAVVHKHLPSVWRLNGFVRRGYLFDVAQPRPVEMHLQLWDTQWRGLDLLPLPDVWQNCQRVNVDDSSVRVLSLHDTCVHLCVHLATHLVEREARVGQAIDIARLLTKRSSEINWERVIAASEHARVTRFVYLALRAVNTLTGAPLPPQNILDALRAKTPARLRAWVEQNGARDVLSMDFRDTDLSRAYALTFAATQSWQERARVLRFALFPPMDTLQAEYGGQGLWLYARHLEGRGRVYFNALRQRRTDVSFRAEREISFAKTEISAMDTSHPAVQKLPLSNLSEGTENANLCES